MCMVVCLLSVSVYLMVAGLCHFKTNQGIMVGFTLCDAVILSGVCGWLWLTCTSMF